MIICRKVTWTCGVSRFSFQVMSFSVVLYVLDMTTLLLLSHIRCEPPLTAAHLSASDMIPFGKCLNLRSFRLYFSGYELYPYFVASWYHYYLLCLTASNLSISDIMLFRKLPKLVNFLGMFFGLCFFTVLVGSKFTI